MPRRLYLALPHPRRVFFFPILASILVQLTLLQFFLADRSLVHPRSLFRYVGVAAFLGLAYSRSPRVHEAAFFALLALFVFYSVFIFGSITA